MAKDYLQSKQHCPPLVFQFLSYLHMEKAVTAGTFQQYDLSLREFSRFLLAHREKKEDISPLDICQLEEEFFLSLQRQEISAYLQWLAQERQLSVRTRNRKIAVLRSFYLYLEEMDYVSKNVMRRVSGAKTTKTLPQYMEREQMEALLEAVNGRFWLRDRGVILLMMSAGLRVSEVAGLNLSRWHGDHLIVLGKGQKERLVYLTQQTQESLAEYAEIRPDTTEEAFFLSAKNQAMSIRTIQHTVKKYLTVIGLEDYSCHKLRHTATTEIYTHVSKENLKQCALE